MWRRITKWFIASTAVALITAAGQAYALDVPTAPTLDRPIVDTTSTLTDQQVDALVQRITKSRSEKSYQIGILMISSLEDEALEDYSLDVARTWGIGEDKTDNGVLLLIVKDDRKVRIEVGRGLEGDLTDVKSSRIIRNIIRPEFRDGDYYGGISGAVNSIHLALTNQVDPATAEDSEASGAFMDSLPTLMFMVFIGFMYLASLLARSKSWWGGGVIGGIAGFIWLLLSGWSVLAIIATIILIPFGLIFDFLVSRNYTKHAQDGTAPSWWAGGTSIGGGGWGSGGGGGFGGGGFSGGGASGDW